MLLLQALDALSELAQLLALGAVSRRRALVGRSRAAASSYAATAATRPATSDATDRPAPTDKLDRSAPEAPVRRSALGIVHPSSDACVGSAQGSAKPGELQFERSDQTLPTSCPRSLTRCDLGRREAVMFTVRPSDRAATRPTPPLGEREAQTPRVSAQPLPLAVAAADARVTVRRASSTCERSKHDEVHVACACDSGSPYRGSPPRGGVRGVRAGHRARNSRRSSTSGVRVAAGARPRSCDGRRVALSGDVSWRRAGCGQRQSVHRHERDSCGDECLGGGEIVKS